MKQIDLLFNILEQNNIYEDGSDLNIILNKMVHTISEFMKSTVCSIYCIDEQSGELILFATAGLNPEAIGKIKMKITEGLAGLALRESRVIYDERGSTNPNFKSIPGINEEKYDIYLVLPIEKGITKIGIIILQREIGKTFTKSEIRLSKAVSSYLAVLIENARLMNDIGSLYKAKSHKIVKTGIDATYNIIQGKTASEGYNYSEIYKISQTNPFFIKESLNKKYTREEFIEA